MPELVLSRPRSLRLMFSTTRVVVVRDTAQVVNVWNLAGTVEWCSRTAARMRAMATKTEVQTVPR